MQLPSRPSLQTALGGSVIELEHQEEGQTLLGSGASEAAPSPPQSCTQKKSAKEDKGRKFGPADRSCDHFWPLSIRPFDLCARTPRSRSFSSTGPAPPFHHINFLGQKVFVRSATPPEVSYWAAFLSTYTKPHRTFSRKGVIVAQANKFIDPFRYIPNESEGAIGGLCGSALVAALDGRVKKAYPNAGTWLEEREEDGDEAPICFDKQILETQPIYYSSTVPTNQLVLPHKMNERDQHDLVINGPQNFTPPASRMYKNVARKQVRRPSGLRTIAVSEAQEDLVDEVNSWNFDRSQRRYANFAAMASRLSSVTGEGDGDLSGPVEVDTNPNPTGANSECSVGQSGVELGAEELALVRRGLEVLGMQEDSDSSDSEDDDFWDDDDIGLSDEDEDSSPRARERNFSIHAGYRASEFFTAGDTFPPMQVYGPVWPSQSVFGYADNCHPAEAMHDFNEEGDVGLQHRSDHDADFMIQPLHLTNIGTQDHSNLRFKNTILDSSEDGHALQNTSTNSIQQDHFLPSASDVETAVHESSEGRYASYQNLIEQRSQRPDSLATDGHQTLSSLWSAIGSFSHHNYSEERIGRIQNWVHQQQQQQQPIRPKLEGKYKLDHLKAIIEKRKAAAMLRASSLEWGSGSVRDISRGAGYYSRRSTICKKNESYLDNPVGGVLWFLFLFVCFLYVWDLLP